MNRFALGICLAPSGMKFFGTRLRPHLMAGAGNERNKTAEFEGKIEKAKLEGDKISFEINIQYGKVSFDGTVSGDEMKLNVTGTTGNKMTLIAKRQK